MRTLIILLGMHTKISMMYYYISVLTVITNVQYRSSYRVYIFFSLSMFYPSLGIRLVLSPKSSHSMRLKSIILGLMHALIYVWVSLL